jgi:hypothetical protein
MAGGEPAVFYVLNLVNAFYFFCMILSNGILGY